MNQDLWRAWRYDSVNRVTEDYANATLPDKQRSVFRYDALGRLIQVADSILANACITNDPDYGGRWCATTQAFFQSNGGYGYDAVGNMTSVADVSGAGAPTYATGNRLTAWPGYTFGNDAVGNRIWQVKTATPNDTTRYFWSAEGLLDSVQVKSSGSLVRTLQYDYNAAGQLVRKRVNGAAASYFLWGGARPAARAAPWWCRQRARGPSPARRIGSRVAAVAPVARLCATMRLSSSRSTA